MSQVAANLEQLYRRINNATQRVGRSPDEVMLVAVTKTHPIETVIAAYQAGLRYFGENRADEGAEKAALFADWLTEQHPNGPPHWHFIGHLQSRQVGTVLEGGFDLIHSVDSLKLAQRINRLAARDDCQPINILLQCNVSGEATKSGFELSQWAKDKAQFKAFVDDVVQIANLDKVVIHGLMTMAPIVDDPEDVRPVFNSLAKLRLKLKDELPQIDWRHLSMGMTDDFEVAIEEGTTLIRVGRAIFGERRQ